MPTSLSMQSLSPEQLQQKAVQAAALLRALANPGRLALLCQMVEGERCVGEFEQATGIVQPTLSQQLGVLRREGLVQTRREGTRIYYRLEDPAVMAVLSALHGIFCGRAQARPGRRRTA